MKTFKVLLTGSLLAIGALSMLSASISEKKEEQAALNATPVMKAQENKNEEYRKYYPRQYDSWKKTKNSDDLHDMLKDNPQMVVLFSGYGFAKDYSAPRGHFYAIEDNQNSLRTGAPKDEKTGPMPTACWTCKSPDVPRLMDMVGEQEYFTGKWAKYGSEVVNPIGCADCHNNSNGMQLEVNRDYLARAMEAEGSLKMKDATHQDMRSLVCAQCHVEYYFKKTPYTDKDGNKKIAKVVTLPWDNGMSAEDIEKYYDERGFKDWTHKLSRTPMLKAQHPGYEMLKQGVHGQRGVSCADCHMPYTQEGGVKYSDHNIGNPLDNIEKTCLNCHKESEKTFLDNVKRKYDRKNELSQAAMTNLAKAHFEAKKAWELGATEAEMKEVLTNIRHGQWRWDYATASHGSFFHAPEETLRVLGTSLIKSGEARTKLRTILAKYGAGDFKAPDFSSKAKAQVATGLPFEKLVAEKKVFLNTLKKEWDKEAEKKGHLNPEWKKEIELKTAY